MSRISCTALGALRVVLLLARSETLGKSFKSNTLVIKMSILYERTLQDPEVVYKCKLLVAILINISKEVH